MNASTVSTLLGIVIVAAGTSAFSEKEFSIVRRIRTRLRNGMINDIFYDLGVLNWFNDDMDNIINAVKVGNLYVADGGSVRFFWEWIQRRRL